MRASEASLYTSSIVQTRSVLITLVRLIAELVMAPVLFCASVCARLVPKQIDVGLGPEPLINNVYHKRALERLGYSAETFVTSVYFITQEFDRKFVFSTRILTVLFSLVCGAFLFAVFRYRCLYIYFNGGPLLASRWLWRLEPFLLRLAGIATVVMPYGGDVQEMVRSPNLMFKHVMAQEYPLHRFKRNDIAKRIDLWTRYGTHVISGCEWVDYMYYWDTLMVAHFSIDTEQWHPRDTVSRATSAPLRILHAPNHKQIKGTEYFIRAVEDLQAEGISIELVLLEGVPNTKIRELMKTADIVADQLIIGWYAMLAIEAMALGKPVICYLREDLRELYRTTGLLRPGEPPIVSCTTETVKDALREFSRNRERLAEIGIRSRAFVERVHSVEAVGRVFDRINRSIGITPACRPSTGT